MSMYAGMYISKISLNKMTVNTVIYEILLPLDSLWYTIASVMLTCESIGKPGFLGSMKWELLSKTKLVSFGKDIKSRRNFFC